MDCAFPLCVLHLAGTCHGEPDQPAHIPTGRARGMVADAVATIAERAVRSLERRWLDAYQDNDLVAMRTIVADEFIITFASGQMQTKAQLLRQLEADPPPLAGYRFHTRSVRARAFGDTVVLTGLLVRETSRDGRPHRAESLYTDTWIRREGRWQVVASHLSDSPQTPRPAS